MHLAEFILSKTEEIVAEWEVFASSLLPAASGMTSLALRDHAQQILEAIAKDICTPQTSLQQAAKSKGHAPSVDGAPQTAAQTHAILRARSGFDINQLVAEYRALRASVLRLWMAKYPPTASDVEDIIRFNEAIDQAVAESVCYFHAQVEQARNLLLGMLGHDMRSPLNTILNTATYLNLLNAGQEISQAAARLIRSGASMKALLDDLVDFNRTRLGLGIRVNPGDVDLATVAEDEIEQLRAAHAGCPIELNICGETRGCWDGVRIQQVLRNLVSNAIFYGTPHSPVRVALVGQVDQVRLEVSNHGAAIHSAELASLFDPLRRTGFDSQRPVNESGLGLGLFIVREIARAHGGDVEVCLTHDETTFVVSLPREGLPTPNVSHDSMVPHD